MVLPELRTRVAPGCKVTVRPESITIFAPSAPRVALLGIEQLVEIVSVFVPGVFAAGQACAGVAIKKIDNKNVLIKRTGRYMVISK